MVKSSPGVYPKPRFGPILYSTVADAEDITVPKRGQETALSLKLNMNLCPVNDSRYLARYRCIYFFCLRQRNGPFVSLTRPVVNEKSRSREQEELFSEAEYGLRPAHRSQVSMIFFFFNHR